MILFSDKNIFILGGLVFKPGPFQGNVRMMGEKNKKGFSGKKSRSEFSSPCPQGPSQPVVSPEMWRSCSGGSRPGWKSVCSVNPPIPAWEGHTRLFQGHPSHTDPGAQCPSHGPSSPTVPLARPGVPSGDSSEDLGAEGLRSIRVSPVFPS